MAARANLDKPERPLMTDDKFDIEPDSEVELVTTEGYIIKGNCYRNPAATNTTNAVEIVNCQRFDPQTGKYYSAGFQRFFRDNIMKLIINKDKRPINPSRDIPQRIAGTKVISNEIELETMFNILEKTKIIGLSLQGINVSRDGSVGWICIFTNGILISIDVIKLEQLVPSFWDSMEVKIFANRTILKVVHDIRPMVDFLFHLKAVKPKNLFDCQLGELYIRYHTNRDKMPTIVDGKRVSESEYNWDAKPLSYCIEKFIPEKVFPLELPHLKEFEKQDFTARNPLMTRSETCDLNKKRVAISMKYLIELYEAQTKILMSHFNQCVQQQMKLMLRGNMADHYKHITDPSQVAHNVHEMIIEGLPNIVTQIEEF